MLEAKGKSEVLVAGGGPAGLAAAIAARQAGFDVAVVDCAQPPIDKACGEGIMPEGLAALRELGITLNSAIAAPFRGISFVDEHSRAEAAFSHVVGYGMRRTALHQLLVQRAEETGVSLRWKARITGLTRQGLCINGQFTGYRWLICADGQNSRLRRLAGLDHGRCTSRRYGFRRHYKVAPWFGQVEVHWADCGQMYVTPVSQDEICVAFVTRHRQLRFDHALARFPALHERLGNVAPEKDYLGALTTTREFGRVQSQNIALAGEASGSIDAVTGQGLSLAFRQALALADALRAGDLREYQAAHRRIARRPRLMSALMLAMDRYPALRRRALHALASDPAAFARMLDLHTGALPLREFGLRLGIALGWQLLAA
ncbi:MAG TPA: FAD-dependent monooxygenase [Terriglobales bacterium]|jgi:flavin-dependent dehydrogenase|nr:FAD-dependent monooxygenase [Terriglobales bacterium]